MSPLDNFLSRNDHRTPEQKDAEARAQAEWKLKYDEDQRLRRAEFLRSAPRYEVDGEEARSFRLVGRCSNGSERDGGNRIHIVKISSGVAICRAAPGRRSAGWSDVMDSPATCPRCLKKIKTPPA